MAMFPLSTVLFPDTELALQVFEPRYQSLTEDCLAGSGEFGVVLIARGSEVGGGDQRVGVGTVAHIEQASPHGAGRWTLVTKGTRRIRVTKWLADDPYPLATVEDLPGVASGGDEAAVGRALSAVRRTRGLLSELGRAPALPGAFELGDGLDAAAWRLCALAPLSVFDRQALLEVGDPTARLDELIGLCGALDEDLTALLAEGLS
jgi:Lon protease-like protein